jgi:hypothetical protein
MPSGTAVCALIGSSSTNLPELLLSSASALTASTFGYDAFTFEAELAGDWDATLNQYEAHLNVLSSHYNMPAILSLMKDRVRCQDADNPDNARHKNAILPTKNEATACVDTSRLMCGPCQMAKACRRTPDTSNPCSNKLPGGTLRQGHLRPGQYVSSDHFICSDRGRHLDTYGRNTKASGYVGGALYVDHASGKIIHHPQTDLSASQTIQGKQFVEKAAADLGFHIGGCHSAFRQWNFCFC